MVLVLVLVLVCGSLCSLHVFKTVLKHTAASAQLWTAYFKKTQVNEGVGFWADAHPVDVPAAG
jgi:hypothetical protein